MQVCCAWSGPPEPNNGSPGSTGVRLGWSTPSSTKCVYIYTTIYGYAVIPQNSFDMQIYYLNLCYYLK
jgi:hypothetical protein